MPLNATLKSNLEAGLGPFRWLLVIERDDDSIVQLRYSDAPYTSKEVGIFEPRVMEWGEIHYSYSDRAGSLAAVETRVVVSDTDGFFAPYSETRDSGFLKGATATIYLAHPEIAFADWAVVFTGVLEAWDIPAPQTVAFTLRIDDLALRQDLPGEIWRIKQHEFRSAPAASWNQFAAILFGFWNAADYTNKGAIPLILIDPTADKWLVCAGHALTVHRVFVNGSASSNWSTSYPTIGGKTYTIITYSSTPPADDDEVTADVEGYDYIGDGTDIMVETPANQMVYFLENFVFSQFKTGNWAVTFVRIDAASVETVGAYMDARGYRSARRIDAATTPYRELADWLLSHELRAYWNTSGQLAFDVEAWDGTDWYSAATALEIRNSADFRIEVDREQVLSSVTMSYAQNDAESQFFRSTTAADPRALERAEESFDQTWGIAS